MKARCQYSGIKISDDANFPSVFSSTIHPIFHLPFKKLVNLAELAVDSDRFSGYSDTELKLLSLALLNNMQAELPSGTKPLFIQTATLDKPINTERKNIRSLLIHLPIITYKLSAFSASWLNENIPQFNISQKAPLETDYDYLPFLAATSWLAAIHEILESNIAKRAEIKQLEDKKLHYVNSLSKVARLKGIMANGTREEKTKAIVSYVKLFADFPTTIITNPHTNRDISLADFWLGILKADDSKLLSTNINDITELEDHLIDNLPVDEFSHYVMAFVKDIKVRHEAVRLPFDIADFILSKEDSANFAVLGIDSDTASGPKKVKSIDELLAEAKERKEAKASSLPTVSASFDINAIFRKGN